MLKLAHLLQISQLLCLWLASAGTSGATAEGMIPVARFAIAGAAGAVKLEVLRLS